MTEGTAGEPDGIPEAARAEAQRPIVGPQGDESATVDEHGVGGEGVVPFDMLWSCTTCGACVEQCPVDIEHVDHIVDLRRHQVLMESAFPEEAGIMLRNLEHAGDPWGRGAPLRLEWAEPLDFPVRVFGAEGEDRIPDDVDYLYWVGCAGALDDTAQRTARAVASLPERGRGSASWSWAKPRRARATRPAEWAMSSSSRCSPCRTSRP